MKNIIVVSITQLLLIFIGCSSTPQNPISSSDLDAVTDLPIGEISTSETNRTLLGTWSFELNPCIETIIPHPNRELMGWTQNHLNVKPYLPAPTFQIISYNPILNIYDVDVTINNNSNYDGYDVRLIIHTTDNGISLVNDDGWTPLWDELGGSLINPFKAFATLEPNRKFAAHTSHTARLQIYLPGGTGSVKFAIDASYGGNCPEPYLIRNFTQGTLYDVINSETTLSVEVFDWQDNDQDEVSLFCQQIFGWGWEPFTQVSSTEWQLNIVNRTGAQEGEYLGIIKATSEDLGSLVLYDFVNITIEQGIPSTDWNILIYMSADYNLQGFDEQTINDLEEAGSKEGCLNIIVLWDRYSVDDYILKILRDPSGYNETIISQYLDHPDWVFPSGGLDMKKQETLDLFLRWSVKHYPAKKCALIFWGHGTGPFGDLDRHVNGGLSVWDIGNTCQDIINETHYFDQFSIIGFDCCLMSWIETAYCLRDVCQVGIASEINEPNYGWEYHPTLEYVRENGSNCDVEEISRRIINDFLNSPKPGLKTLAAWRSEQLKNSVIPALNNFSVELINSIPDNKEFINLSWMATGSWGGDNTMVNCNQTHIKDLGYFADQIISNWLLPEDLRDSAQTLRDCIDNTNDNDAIIIHGSNVDEPTFACPFEETGWQIWFPNDYDSFFWNDEKLDYPKIGFSDTYWDEWLDAFDPN